MLTYEVTDEVALIRIDDGRANAISHEFVQQVCEALNRAEQDALAVVIAGREKRFCAGFDLTVMGGSQAEMLKLVGAGAKMLLRIFEFPRPVVAACSGHAIAGGALLLLACDIGIGTAGDFKIGLNETANGMPLPVFGLELAKAKLDPRHLSKAVLHSVLYTPDDAVKAGFLGQVVEPDKVLGVAVERAKKLAQLPAGAYLANKHQLYQATRRAITDSLSAFES